MEFLKKHAAGFLLCLVIAVPAWFLGQLLPVVGGPVFSILTGMTVAALLPGRERGQGQEYDGEPGGPAALPALHNRRRNRHPHRNRRIRHRHRAGQISLRYPKSSFYSSS